MRIRTSRLACLATLVLAALGTPPALAAQAGRIAAIKVTGSRRYAEAQVVAASGLHAGDTVGREEIQAAADRLSALGVFANVRFRFTSAGESVAVEFQVEDAPTVPVLFDNFPWFADDELTAALRQAVDLFDGTAPEQGSILDQMTETLRKLLPTRGIHAAVERVLMARPGGEGMMQEFRVVGASLKINGVQFGDPLAAQSKRIADRISDLVGKPYSRFAVEVFAGEQVRPLYLEQGRLRVRFGTPVTRFTGDPNRPLADSVLVIVPIEPGPVYRFGGVEWTGIAAFGPAALNEFLGLKTGEVADGIKIAAAWARVQDEYGRRGYVEMKLETKPLFDEAAKRVIYRAAITEGAAYRMGELVLTGLSLAGENKLREAWHLLRGETFDGNYFEQFLVKLEKGGREIFGELPIHYEQTGHWLRTDPNTRTVDVLLDFK